jgi:hypothetical protein
MTVENQKMMIRYARDIRGHPVAAPEYLYRGIFNKIRSIEYDGIETKALKSLEAQISRVHDPREREFLQNSLDFHLCGRNLGYPQLPDSL